MSAANFYGSHLPWRQRQLKRGIQLTKLLEGILGEHLLNEPVERQSNWSHVRLWEELAEKIGATCRIDFPWVPTNQIDPQKEKTAQRSQSIWIIHPGARTPAKRWPIENYIRLIKEVLVPANQTVILIDETQTETFIDRGGYFTARTHTVPDLFDLLKSASHFIGNDSFPAHAAAACGLKVWTIFTSADPNIFAPFGNRENVISRDVCSYRPCLDTCLQPDFICLKSVDYQMVKQIILEYIRKSPSVYAQ